MKALKEAIWRWSIVQTEGNKYYWQIWTKSNVEILSSIIISNREHTTEKRAFGALKRFAKRNELKLMGIPEDMKVKR